MRRVANLAAKMAAGTLEFTFLVTCEDEEKFNFGNVNINLWGFYFLMKHSAKYPNFILQI